MRRGEIFGLLGPNGAGKTTTFRMLCGLLRAERRRLHVAGADVRRAAPRRAQRLGYVAQKFSLYGPLTVTENLEFFASAYGLRGARQRARIDWAMQQFELSAARAWPARSCPADSSSAWRWRRRCCTSRRSCSWTSPPAAPIRWRARVFWRRITALAEQGVTVIVTTHFMQEAEYCDRVAIMDAGRVLAQGSPARASAQARASAEHGPIRRPWRMPSSPSSSARASTHNDAASAARRRVPA